MGNSTEHINSNGKRMDSTTAVGIIIPSLFAMVLLVLILVAIVLPRMARGNYESASAREIRQKSRIARLNSLVQTQAYHDWSLSQQDKLPPDTMKTHPICVICLDTIEDAAQIRGLGCLHVFHQTCLDDWFTRMNEFCPLCHRPIVPPDPKTKGRKLARIRTHLPAGTMV